MAIPQFNQHGLLPEGVHDCTFLEAQAFLCSNEHRSAIWARLQRFLDWAAAFPRPAAFLIDGSYVTDKPLPNDVDVIVDVTSCSTEQQKQWFAVWAEQHEFAKLTFSVDFYPFAIGLGSDFSAFFQYVRIEEALRRGIAPTVRKGILKVAR
ncbi:hypothetical protein PQ455_16845 [Sphingomonas naphthae]|uniref:Nucleotidyltransferase domain-containing protein n=1 Tax=Sphingomonas naphthae TaxID=1813468 RepID=A0ABY7TJC7_9SPHN|nr:hypothetical protein [Sphingomonas naphthae]WCT73264.1 hypothetical protein PQ455_16845 [Sphingomonas naphthae]